MLPCVSVCVYASRSIRRVALSRLCLLCVSVESVVVGVVGVKMYVRGSEGQGEGVAREGLGRGSPKPFRLVIALLLLLFPSTYH